MQHDPSPGRRVVCNSPSEGTRFRQSRQSHPEQPGVSDGHQSSCWCHSNPWLMMMALRESNSLKQIIPCQKAIYRQRCSGIGSVAPQARMIPTCKEETEILLRFQFLLLVLSSSTLVLFIRIVRRSPAPWLSTSSITCMVLYCALYLYYWIDLKEKISYLLHSVSGE